MPAGIAAGAVAAILLRTSGADALTLRIGDRVDPAFVARLDPRTTAPAGTPGRYLLVAFGYTSCPDICPATLLAVHQTLEALGDRAARVRPVFVTVDPERDTPDRLRAYVEGFDPRILSVADPSLVRDTLAAFRARARRHDLPAGGYSMDHTAVLYVVDPDRRVIAALPEVAPDLAGDLARALRAEPSFGG